MFSGLKGVALAFTFTYAIVELITKRFSSNELAGFYFLVAKDPSGFFKASMAIILTITAFAVCILGVAWIYKRYINF